MVEKVIEHPHIKAVTLTGSTNAGISVAQKAGSMLKKTVLELGGSDAYVVLADAASPQKISQTAHSDRKTQICSIISISSLFRIYQLPPRSSPNKNHEGDILYSRLQPGF